MLPATEKKLPRSPATLIAAMILTVVLVIVVTEVLESYIHSSEVFESVLHVLALSGLLAPLFYFFWYRPHVQQMALAKASKNEIRRLNHALISAGEVERRRLAHELHDVFGQRLTALQLHINQLQLRLDRQETPTSRLCQPLALTVNDLGTDLRHILADLHPATLDELGLVPALESLCHKVEQQQENLTIAFRCLGIKGRLQPDIEIVLYRVCQEALTNIIRHARADSVEVRLSRNYPHIILTIQDDGIGFSGTEEDKAKNQFGLLGMRERVASVGGRLRIVGKPGEGVRIRAEVPDALASGEAGDD